MGKERNGILKAVWGISKELGIDKEELYILLGRETGKDHMTECSDDELRKLLRVLAFYKDKEKLQQSGNGPSDKQLKYIRDMEKQLGWNNEPERLRGFVKKLYKVDALEWLSTAQASKVIEALKNMLKNQKKKEAV